MRPTIITLIVILSLSLGFLFLAPIIPVNGSTYYAAGHCAGDTLNWTDRQSIGYRFLGIGYHQEAEPPRTLCL